MLKKLAGVVVALLLFFLLVLVLAGRGLFGSLDRGTLAEWPRPEDSVKAAARAQTLAATTIGATRDKQILFGDLHVHTTISFDAFLRSLPLLQGEGAHPPADACDFARYCSALDFWSINDHAEGISPPAWAQTVESIRQCNAVASDPNDPDTVAFLGWEWTQVGATPGDHWGHKNIILADLDDAKIPARPIGATGTSRQLERAQRGAFALGALALSEGGRLYDFATYMSDRASVPECASDVDSRELPADCMERAEEPADLFRKLDEWGSKSIVIPHGTTWGMYTPPASDWAKQLTRRQHDPDRQTLVEIYSGHGNSEEYRDWRAVRFDDDGAAVCPESSDAYEPPCQRAGEIVRSRCLAEGEDASECDGRAERARSLAAAALGQAHLAVPGYEPEEWLDAGQCRDCAQPAFNYRPAGSAQYMMALSNFEDASDPGDPLRFRFGFMASSDNHYARPGTGYKEFARTGMTESSNRDLPDSVILDLFRPPVEEQSSEARPFERESSELFGFQLFEMERQASYFMTGGLIAAHSSGRDRSSIWDALERREVYGTSGPRILLWFDLLNPPGSLGRSLPMGGETEMRSAPIFQARAVGSFEQEPGCPDYVTDSLEAQRIEGLCKGECYNPSDRRRAITRIEVIRIRPQIDPNEPIAPLIEDPWQVFECEPDPAGCAVTFADPDYSRMGRDTLYYVRAIEAAAPAINADGVRCRRDETGDCTSVDLCGTDPERDPDCLAEHEPRAWSSPIFVDWRRDS